MSARKNMQYPGKSRSASGPPTVARMYSGNSHRKPDRERLILRLVKWAANFWVGLALVVLTHVFDSVATGFRLMFSRDSTEDEPQTAVKVWPAWRVMLYRALPLKFASRLFSSFAHSEIPDWLRPFALRAFAWLCQVDLSEAADKDLRNYACLGDFFNRELRPETRPINQTADLVCPADGRVLACGRVRDEAIEHVKGLNYTLAQFLADKDGLVSSMTPSNCDLHYCVIYLSPSNYHGFHSPLDWSIRSRRHITGDLMSVQPSLLLKVPDVLALNERVCLMGTWPHGFFSMTAVGATNVGNIRLHFDQNLRTNNSKLFADYRNFWTSKKVQPDILDHLVDERHFSSGGDGEANGEEEETGSVKATRGEHLGEFRFGSTVVLIFSAPKSFRFCVDSQLPVKYGQPLGYLGMNVMDYRRSRLRFDSISTVE